MINEIKKIVKIQKKINIDIKNQSNDFDEKDVVETYNNVESELKKFIKLLEKYDSEKKNNLEEQLVHIELNLANLAWVIDQVRKYIRDTVIKL